MTDTEASTLHMVQLYLDPRGLVQLGKMLHLPLARTGTNYLVHCALGELFGDEAPKPFYVDDDPRSVQESARQRPDRHVRVLGYTTADDEVLHEVAKLCPNPTVYALCDWDRFVSKPMPEVLAEGTRLGFELRACPVVRKASAGAGRNAEGEKRTWREGEELDAFLSAQWDSEEKLEREDVYRAWLERQLDIRGGAEITTFAMERFSIERMTRRKQNPDRTAAHFQAPDATFTGTLTVTDPDTFAELLASGIGRHKSFGYGMLKIRRA